MRRLCKIVNKLTSVGPAVILAVFVALVCLFMFVNLVTGEYRGSRQSETNEQFEQIELTKNTHAEAFSADASTDVLAMDLPTGRPTE